MTLMRVARIDAAMCSLAEAEALHWLYVEKLQLRDSPTDPPEGNSAPTGHEAFRSFWALRAMGHCRIHFAIASTASSSGISRL